MDTRYRSRIITVTAFITAVLLLGTSFLSVFEKKLSYTDGEISYFSDIPEIKEKALTLTKYLERRYVYFGNFSVEKAQKKLEEINARLSENNVVELDDERKAVMVSNLLVVLCGSKDAQPIVNSGSLY